MDPSKNLILSTDSFFFFKEKVSILKESVKNKCNHYKDKFIVIISGKKNYLL